MGDYGLYRDEHKDFCEEMQRLRVLRGKAKERPSWVDGKPPEKIVKPRYDGLDSDNRTHQLIIDHRNIHCSPYYSCHLTVLQNKVPGLRKHVWRSQPFHLQTDVNSVLG